MLITKDVSKLRAYFYFLLLNKKLTSNNSLNKKNWISLTPVGEVKVLIYGMNLIQVMF